jgi:hypothetical protein
VRFDLTRPCGRCPFRSDIRFGLRPARVLEILRDRRGFPAPSFACHKTVDYDADQPRVPPDAQHCAGVLAILHREGRPNDMMQIAERLGIWDPASLDPTAPFYDSTDAAIAGQGP